MFPLTRAAWKRLRLALARLICPPLHEVVAIPHHRMTPAQQEAYLRDAEARLRDWDLAAGVESWNGRAR